MPYNLAFDNLILYDPGKNGISLSVLLSLGHIEANIEAKLDTGSSHCIFQRVHGERLGLNIESGYPMNMSTANGFFMTYGHDVTLSVLDFKFDVMVYFAKDEEFARDVLGRHGFLNQVQIGLRDYQGELYLSRND